MTNSPKATVQPRSLKRRIASVAMLGLGALALVGCTAEIPRPDVGHLRLQVECGTVDAFYTTDATEWFTVAGFNEVTLGVNEEIVAQLSRGQVLAGVMHLSTAAEAILVDAQPLVVVAVIPDADDAKAEAACAATVDEEVDTETDDETADTVTDTENPLVLVTTRDVLRDYPDALRALLAAEAASRASTLGGALSDDSSESPLSASGVIGLTELADLTADLGYPLSEERLVVTGPLNDALMVGATLSIAE